MQQHIKRHSPRCPKTYLSESINFGDPRPHIGLHMRRDPDGHACVNLSTIDTLSHRVIAENLSCQDGILDTRVSLLRAMASALEEAILDAADPSE